MANNKYGSYGGKTRRRPRIGALILVVILLTAGILGYRQYIFMVLGQANTALVIKEFEEAEKKFRKAASLPLGGGLGRDGLGALALRQGDRDSAKEHFKTALENKTGRFGGRPEVIFDLFLGEGNYAAAKDYRDFLESWKNETKLTPYLLDFAAASLGLRNLEKARGYLDKVDASLRASNRYERLAKSLDQYSTEGQIPILLDRNGKVLLHHDIATGERRFSSPSLFAGWLTDGAIELADLTQDDMFNQVHTTLDINLQRAAHQAMQGYAGTMIMVEPASGKVLAAYGTEDRQPFTTAFEPGSVVKVITYGAYLAEGRDTAQFAPRNYPGNEEIGGKIFYDWTTQGQLESVNEGMAVSCNLMFAHMGIDLGWSRIDREIRTFLSGVPENQMLLAASHGSLVGEPEGAWDIGRASIGLDFPSATVLGLVRVSSSVANNGQLIEPWILGHMANHEGNTYRHHSEKQAVRRYTAPIAAELSDSMISAVTSERGTARRARVSFLDAAMKTGTAGDRPFDSVMIGFFPVEQPKVAFAFFLDKGGKCEIHGGRVAKRLQEQIKALAPEYLDR